MRRKAYFDLLRIDFSLIYGTIKIITIFLGVNLKTLSFLLILISTTISSSLRAEFLPQSFSAKFQQEYISILKGKTKKGEGLIDYKYPGSIRFETSSPSPVVYVSNGNRAWYYRAPFIEGEEGEVSETSAKEGTSVYIKFFDSLKNGLTANSLYDVKNAGDGIHVVIFKSATAKEFGIKEAILMFNSKKDKNFSELQKVELLFPDGKKSSLTFVNLKINPGFDSTHFNFVAPPKTKKIN